MKINDVLKIVQIISEDTEFTEKGRYLVTPADTAGDFAHKDGSKQIVKVMRYNTAPYVKVIDVDNGSSFTIENKYLKLIN